MTLEQLKEWGANTDEGMMRCLNNEQFYLKMVDMAIDNDGYGKLEEAINAHDLKAAFDAAHALKGILANLALTPLQSVVSEMTELLRAGTDTDYAPYIADMKARYQEFAALR